MPAEQKIAFQRGEALIRGLSGLNSDQLTPSAIKSQYSCSRPDGKIEMWKYFVPFPKEVKNLFPGSYISPEAFLANLNKESNTTENVQALLGEKKANDQQGNPVFTTQVQQEQGGTVSTFKVEIMNGLTNPDALEISTLSKQYGPDFLSAQGRVRYQDALISGAGRNICYLDVSKYGMIIHDDCMASGDTIAGYLLRRIIENQSDPKIAKGIKVVIDGPATAQSILLLKQISKAFHINIDISANWMAFGLSEGILKSDGTREHANYITYPDPLIEKLPGPIADKLKQLKSADDPNAYVCGDMGNASEGYSKDELEELKVLDQSETWQRMLDRVINIHKERLSTVSQIRKQFPCIKSDCPDYVVFPRGGYQSYCFTSYLKNSILEDTNIIVEQASRRDDPELGYGVVFDRLDAE